MASNAYKFTGRGISSSFLLLLETLAAFLLIPSGLWNTGQILADKYTFLQQFQGRQQRAPVKQSIS